MGDFEERAGVVKGITDAFPEATKEVNKALTTIGKAINVALLPLSGIVWGYDKIAAWFEPKLAEKLKNVPPENIITPPIHIAGPTIEAMRFTGKNDELREMYANLLAAAMNKETTNQVHPRFVEVIKNISEEEAILINLLNDNNFTCINRDSFQIYGSSQIWYYYSIDKKPINHYINKNSITNLNVSIDNLCHLSFLFVEQGYIQGEMRGHEILSEFPNVDSKLKCIINASRMTLFKSNFNTLILTSFGQSFIEYVVKSK